MSTAILTIIGAILLMGLVVALLAIGWILTGKVRLKRKSCGSMVKTKKEEGPCSFCGGGTPCEKEEAEAQKEDKDPQDSPSSKDTPS